MAVRKGPRKTVTTVVLKALLAQSYMAQPKISRRSLTRGRAMAVIDAASLLAQECGDKRRVLPTRHRVKSVSDNPSKVR